MTTREHDVRLADGRTLRIQDAGATTEPTVVFFTARRYAGCCTTAPAVRRGCPWSTGSDLLDPSTPIGAR